MEISLINFLSYSSITRVRVDSVDDFLRHWILQSRLVFLRLDCRAWISYPLIGRGLYFNLFHLKVKYITSVSSVSFTLRGGSYN